MRTAVVGPDECTNGEAARVVRLPLPTRAVLTELRTRHDPPAGRVVAGECIGGARRRATINRGPSRLCVRTVKFESYFCPPNASRPVGQGRAVIENLWSASRASESYDATGRPPCQRSRSASRSRFTARCPNGIATPRARSTRNVRTTGFPNGARTIGRRRRSVSVASCSGRVSPTRSTTGRISSGYGAAPQDGNAAHSSLAE